MARILRPNSFLKRHYAWLILAMIYIYCGSVQAKINLKKLEKQNWAQVTTDNFSIISDQGENAAFKLAEKLEMFRNTYKIIGSVPIPDDARPVKVISTKRTATYKMLAGKNKNLKNTGGFFTDSVSGNYAVIKAGKMDSKNTRKSTSTSVLLHEYTHYLTASLSTVNSPYWYNEGLADYLSHVKFPDHSTFHLGLPIEYHLRNLNQMRWKSMEEILKATHISNKHRGEDRYRIYSQSWLMIHWCKNGTKRNKQLTKYLSMLAKGSSVDDAFRASFAMSYKELDRELKIYRTKRGFDYVAFQLKKPWRLEKFNTTTLATDDVLFELGEVLLNARSDPAQARQLFERAVEINPRHASALAGVANIRMYEELDKAKSIIEQARLFEPDNVWVSTIAGHIYSRYAMRADNKSERTSYWNQAVRSYSHAINSAGTNLEAISSAADLYMASGRWQKAKDLVEIAYAFAPSNYSLRRQLIAVNYALGDIESAEKIVALVKRNNHMSQTSMEKFDNWVEEIKMDFGADLSAVK